MKRMEVRCCCTPQKLQGWIWVHRDHPIYTFPLMPERNLHTMREAWSRGNGTEIEVVKLQKELLHNSLLNTDYYALKAEHIAPKDLRRISGFEPAYNL